MARSTRRRAARARHDRDMTAIRRWLEHRHGAPALVLSWRNPRPQGLSIFSGVLIDDRPTLRRAAEDAARAARALGHAVDEVGEYRFDAAWSEMAASRDSAHARLADVRRVEAALAAAGEDLR